MMLVMSSFSKIVFIRHGQSEWNKKNLFTGWVDVSLSPEGIKEALDAGKKIANIPFDVIFTSSLIRAKMTAMLAMSQHKGGKVPVFTHKGEGKLEEWGKSEGKDPIVCVNTAWELNERMYGTLQGLNKEETAQKYGQEQVKLWRRSYDVPPPQGESLEMTAKRTLPYFEETIVPYLKDKKNVLVSAHGNSLRALLMKIENLSKEKVLELEIPTGIPICYSYIEGQWEREEL